MFRARKHLIAAHAAQNARQLHMTRLTSACPRPCGWRLISKKASCHATSVIWTTAFDAWGVKSTSMRAMSSDSVSCFLTNRRQVKLSLFRAKIKYLGPSIQLASYYYHASSNSWVAHISSSRLRSRRSTPEGALASCNCEARFNHAKCTDAVACTADIMFS